MPPWLSMGRRITFNITRAATPNVCPNYPSTLVAPLPARSFYISNVSIKLQAALEALPTVDNITVSATDYGPNGGREWNVTFSGSETEGNVPAMTVDTVGLTGSGVRAEVAELTPGNEPTGRFMLQVDTAPRGWPEHRSGWISVGSTTAEVEQAVTQIPGVRAADVTVNASLPTVGPIAWEITFSHRQQQELVDSEDDVVSTIVGNEFGSFVTTGQHGDRPPLRVVRAQLLGTGARADAETVHDGERAIGGTFEVYFRGVRGVANGTVNADASADNVHLALVEHLGLPETTEVVRVGPLDDSLAYTWTVTLPEGMTLWGNASSGVAEDLVVNGSLLSGEGGMFVQTSLVRAGAAPVGGQFNLSLAREEEVERRWISLTHNATDDEVATAIASLSASGGNVSVSSEYIFEVGGGNHTDNVVLGKRWVVTFSALTAAGDIPMIEVNGSGLLTGASAGVSVNETSKGVTADIQELTIDGYSGTFSLFFAEYEEQHTMNVSTANSTSSSVDWTPTPSPLCWNATSSDLEAALLGATGQRVYVERSPVTSLTNSNSGGYIWLVLFAEALSGTWGSVHLNTTNLVPDDDHLAGPSRQANLTLVRNSTTEAIGGGFSLKFGQSCDERAAGVYCTVAETQHIRFDSSLDEVTAELEALPAIVDATVTATGGDDDNTTVDTSFWDDGVGKIAPDGFGVPSAGARFRVTFDSVSLNVSGSALAEYWRSTWSPEKSATEWSGNVATGGDLPLLDVDVSGVVGTHAAAQTKESTKGLSTEIGGVVALEVSQNAGRDYTTSGVTYVYEALVSVRTLVPDHGPIFGGTEVSLELDKLKALSFAL